NLVICVSTVLTRPIYKGMMVHDPQEELKWTTWGNDLPVANPVHGRTMIAQSHLAIVTTELWERVARRISKERQAAGVRP
ncbi:recombinase family protein, partial [Staphylococcus aureus]